MMIFYIVNYFGHDGIVTALVYITGAYVKHWLSGSSYFPLYHYIMSFSFQLIIYLQGQYAWINISVNM